MVKVSSLLLSQLWLGHLYNKSRMLFMLVKACTPNITFQIILAKLGIYIFPTKKFDRIVEVLVNFKTLLEWAMYTMPS